MAKILLISALFPPENSIACRRVYSFAKELTRLGHTIVVLTADIPIQEESQGFNVDISAFNVHRVKYFDFRRFTKKISESKEKTNNNHGISRFVSFLCLLIVNSLSDLSRCLFERGVFWGNTRLPTFIDPWFFDAYRVGKEIINKENIDIILTSSPPPVVNLIGLFLKRSFAHVLWISDYRDLWTMHSTEKGIFPFTAVERALERKCVLSADIILIVSEIWKDWFSLRYPQKKQQIFCMENGFDEELLSIVSDKENKNKQVLAKKVILYNGTLYRKRNYPELLFVVINEYHSDFEDRLEVVFYGPKESEMILEELFMRYPNARTIIKYGGFLSQQDLLRKQIEADAFLLIEDERGYHGVLPGKMFEYLFFRKPILCIGFNANSYLGEFLSKTGLCIFCEYCIERVRDILFLLIKDNAAIYPNEDYINKFSRRLQIKRLNRIIDNWLSDNPLITSIEYVKKIKQNV